MARVQLEHAADRRDYKLILVRQIQAVQAIDKLGAIGHCDFFRMAIEDVERHSAEHSVAQSRSLFECIARSRFAARAIPRTPLIHDQLHMMMAINFTKDLPMAGYQTLHALAFAEQFIPIHGLEL